MKTKPFTVLFDANPLMTQRTGIGHYTARLIEHMAKSRPDIRFVGYYYNFLGRKQPPKSPNAENISYRAIYAFPGPLINLLRRFNIEIPIELLTWSRADFILYPNFLGHPSLFKTPSAPVVHDLTYLDFPDSGSAKAVRDLTRFVPRAIHRASFVMTVSEFSKQRIVDSYNTAPDRIITTFIPPLPIHPLPDDEARAILKSLEIAKPYLFFIGTMEPRKNIPRLLEAYTQLPESVRSEFSLLLAGKLDWKYQETKQKLEAMQHDGFDIQYLGYVDDKTQTALYQNARLFVMASYYEGFGMPILEALSYGVPCAVSDIAVFHEVGGNVVTYFDCQDPKSIAAVVTKCLSAASNPAKQLQEYVATCPNWDNVSYDVLQKIMSVAKEKP